MPSRVRNHPFLTLAAVVSAVLIVIGRVNRTDWWGDWVFFGGIARFIVAASVHVVDEPPYTLNGPFGQALSDKVKDLQSGTG